MLTTNILTGIKTLAASLYLLGANVAWPSVNGAVPQHVRSWSIPILCTVVKGLITTTPNAEQGPLEDAIWWCVNPRKLLKLAHLMGCVMVCLGLETIKGLSSSPR